MHPEEEYNIVKSCSFANPSLPRDPFMINKSSTPGTTPESVGLVALAAPRSAHRRRDDGSNVDGILA